MAFAAVFELSGLDGTNGFRALGVAAIDNAGWSVASAGDVNGDGIADLIIGAHLVDANGSGSGASYVVFGRDTIGDGDFPADFALSALDGANGFRISGGAALDQAGRSVASAGDVNGDGIDDLIIGARFADPTVGNSGASYVVFGRDTQTAGAFAADLDVNALDGTNGFRISGATGEDLSGFSVASAGDINGDGIDDLIVGAPMADANGVSSGASYVVFGRDTLAAGAFAADLNVGALDGTNGFRIVGAATFDQSGFAVSSAGDVNGDGIDDLIVGAPWVDPTPGAGGAGAIFVVFGKDTTAAGAFAADLNLSALDGTTGFRVDGLAIDETGYSVSGAGDINGDGVDDLIFGAPGADPNGGGSGSSYVVFGRNTAAAGAFAANLSVADLDGTNGFRINGVAAGDGSGLSVASAGDVNGDGYGDVIVSAHRADPNGASSGASFVVFGGVDGFAAVLELSALDGTNGFRINGMAAGDIAGRSVAAAGDVNGDGVDDLIIGANGVNGTGGAYVVFGVVDPVTFAGTPGNDTERGSVAADSLGGAGGNDRLRGLAGDDAIDGGDLSDQLWGEAGDDTLSGGQGGDLMWGGAGADGLDGGTEGDKLWGEDGDDTLDGGDGNDLLYGGAGIDTLIGGAGADTLDGGGQADILAGGLGNDIYLIDNAGVTITEAPDEGYDIVRAGLSQILADNIECLQLQGVGDIDGTGNAGANNLQGNAGANRLDGGAGVDTLNGGDGDDIIVGGEANDLLRGGSGADTFLVAHGFGPTLETDQVYDFSTADGDTLDLSGAFAGTLALVSAFTKAAGQMTLTFEGGRTTLRLDVTGDGKADYQMKINGDVTGDSDGWTL